MIDETMITCVMAYTFFTHDAQCCALSGDHGYRFPSKIKLMHRFEGKQIERGARRSALASQSITTTVMNMKTTCFETTCCYWYRSCGLQNRCDALI